MDHFQDLRSEMVLDAGEAGHRDRGPPPRGGHRRSGRDRHALRHAAGDGRQAHALQVRRQERRLAARQDGHVHAEADLPGQRLGHAHATSRCGRAASRCSSTETGYAGLSDMARWYIGGLLTHAPAILRLRRPDDELATSGWCRATRRRSTSCTRSATARRRAHPALLEEPEGQAARVPLPRPVVQPLPGVLGDADGRPRRRPEPDRAARPGRQGPLRPAARGAGQGAPGARLARRGARRARGRPRLPARPAASSPTTSSRPGSTTSGSNEIDAIRLRPHPYEFHLYYDI